jgi:molybdopterin-binding protein
MAKGATTSHVRIDIDGGNILTISITNEAIDELKIAKGQKATALIKASDVRVAVNWPMVREDEVRAAKRAIEWPDATDAGLIFIGRIHTPWTSRMECPR